MALQLNLKLVRQTHRVQVLPQGKAPGTQQALRVVQIEVANARVVMVFQMQTVTKRPLLPGLATARHAEQAPVGEHHQPKNKRKTPVQVNLKHRPNVFVNMQLGLHRITPPGRQCAGR